MRYLAILVGLLTLFLGCDNSGKKSSEKKTADTSDEQLTTSEDTVNLKPEAPITDLTSRQKRMEGQVENITKIDSTKNIISFKVNEIKGSGRLAPPVAVNDTLKIYFPDLEGVQKGKRMTVIIQHNLSAATTSTQAAWSFVKREI